MRHPQTLVAFLQCRWCRGRWVAVWEDWGQTGLECPHCRRTTGITPVRSRRKLKDIPAKIVFART